MMTDFYATLKLAPTATTEEIRQAYRDLALLHHPDKQGGEQEFAKVREAYEELHDPVKRARYDAARTRSFAQSAALAASVDLSELEMVELPGGDALYRMACRCGGAYEVLESALSGTGVVVPCNGCSMGIQVVFQAAEG